MKNTLRELRLIWHCAFAMHYKGMFKYVMWFLMSLLMILPMITWYMTGALHKTLGALSGPSLAIFFLVWITLPGGAIRQNTAANARLVPHLHNRLIQLVVVTALIGITFNALIISLIYGSFGWCFVSLLFYTVGAGWAQSRHFGWPIAIVVFTHRLIIDNLPRNVAAMLTSDNALFVWLILGLVLGAIFIKSTFPRGGDRSWLLVKNVQRQFRQTRDPFSVSKDAGKFILSPYNRALRNACEKRSENLAMLTLGPNGHWGALSAPLVLVFICIVLLKLALLAFPGAQTSDFFRGFGWGVASSILIVMQLAAQNMAMQFSNTRVEQALYRLGAYAPSIKALNRKLAYGIVRAKLQGFFLTLFVALVCSKLMGVSSDKLLIEFAACNLTLPFICLHLRDYSHEAMMDIGYGRIWQFLGVLILAPLTICLIIVPTPLSAWFAIAATSIVCSAMLIGYRGKRMIASPVAFPAGRIET